MLELVDELRRHLLPAGLGGQAMKPITWGELDPQAFGHEPDEVVIVSGHVLYAHDPGKAARMIERMKELGGSTFRVSPDLFHMLVGDSPRPWDIGVTLILDETLPEDSVYREELVG